MTNEWKTYKVTIKNFELLLSARSEDEARTMVLDSIKKGQVSERLRVSDKKLQLTVILAKGLV